MLNKTIPTARQSPKLPPILPRNPNSQTLHNIAKSNYDSIDRRENDKLQVTKLDEWSMNKPNKKAKTMVNTHNISFLYRSNTFQQKSPTPTKTYKFMDAQLFLAKLDSQLEKISEINYFSIYKNLQYCVGVYQNSFNTLLRQIAKYKELVKDEIHQQEDKLNQQRQEHLKNVHQLQQNPVHQYKNQVNIVRETLEQKEKQLKPLKKILRSLEHARIKVLKYALSLGYDVRDEGLLWILKELNEIPQPEQFPRFLSAKEVQFIINRYVKEFQVANVENKLKGEIMGKTINEAYEVVNRRKRRELSLIKENQQINKIYQQKIKDYSPDKHRYLYDQTLQIAQQIEKNQPKPTRYEVIYKQAAKKLNRICKEKIHQHTNDKKTHAKGKQNKGSSKKQNKKDTEKQLHRKEKRKSTLIVEEFSKLLAMSMDQTKRIQQLYSQEEKQLEEILREIRLEKYNEKGYSKAGGGLNYNIYSDCHLRNAVSILSCLLGWKKAEKVIEQQMFTL